MWIHTWAGLTWEPVLITTKDQKGKLISQQMLKIKTDSWSCSLSAIASRAIDYSNLCHLFSTGEGTAARGLGLREVAWCGWARPCNFAEPRSACLSDGSILVSPRTPVIRECLSSCFGVSHIMPET